MPHFQGDEAVNYDAKITKLVPGYELLHQLTGAQLLTLLPDDSIILVVGAGSGRDIIELASINESWHFIAQDISADMLDIAEAQFTDHSLLSRVTFHYGELTTLDTPVDAALCLLVMHFLPDNGSKDTLLHSIRRNMVPSGTLFIADLVVPETKFEREAQLAMCRTLGLTEIGEQRMRHNLSHEFYPLNRIRLAELLEISRFSNPHHYFKALGFSGIVCHAL
ncbi:class I SAM-dependent methyltransferase [Pseudoalteromonas aurantia]|uniref:Class I SAM-dependent methyltransferase n=1 Tax=Pseudoalteromonas aurantia TaxID=43654 RepID=A0A5S3VBD2_9GAMM|nr:class I SAM-dependent methyltransferase [Pseudoalteromonas aurantia]TMO59046.1 class I SAM-dependent methyltransferase [Pseudoalteromonas aurantia]TMO68831.1 class I SAM-dependent methyltransferase [Pseudoalteromonas aurantia]TMO78098.1 class I SAM-dependent methyltransferase [Pseudoalteromonas aurantia]